MIDTPETLDPPPVAADAATAPNEDARGGASQPAAPADRPPDRLSTNPRSDWFDADVLSRGIGIRLNGAEKTTVDEYCVSEGWVRVAAGRSRDRHGNPMTLRLAGTVEPYYRDTAGAAPD